MAFAIELKSKTFINILRSEPHSAININANPESEIGSQSKLSDHEVIANIKTMILAGSETTSVVLSWALFFLSQAQHKHHLLKLRQEADENLSTTVHQSRVELPFASACFREALRLKGPVAFVGNSKSTFFQFIDSFVSRLGQ